MFVRTASYRSPVFEANVAGKYVVRLNVWDGCGHRSCVAAEEVVFVVPNQAIHIEVLWTSPGDANPYDEGPTAGTDLDLHLAHPNAAQEDLDGDGTKDPWFDPFGTASGSTRCRTGEACHRTMTTPASAATTSTATAPRT